MKAEYREGQNPGNGIILLQDANELSGVDAIAIQRASDQKFLTGRENNPWVGEVFYFPVAVNREQDIIEIPIGPDIVDQLDPQEQYAIRIQGRNGRIRLKLDSITYSPSGSLGNTAQAQEQTQTEPVTQPSQPVQPTVEQTPEPSPPNPPLQLSPQVEPAKSGKKTAMIIAVLAILALALLAWYFLAQPQNENGKEAPATQAPARSAEQPKPKSASPLSAEDQVRQFFKSGRISPGEAMELARKLPATAAADQDAVYRLWYFAAENHEPSAYLPYGKTLDPSAAPYGTISKNAWEAWQAYEKAREKDPQKAEQAMTGLRNWLNEEAAKGNKQAKDWLLQIDQPR